MNRFPTRPPAAALAFAPVLLSTLLAALPAAAQTGYSVQSDATGKNGDHLFRIDLATGVATDIGPTGYGDVESLAFATGCSTLYGVDDVTDRLVRCDTRTGACMAVGGLGFDVTDTGLAFAADGNLYMSTDAPKNPSRLFRLDPATGHATVVGGQGQEVTGLAGTAPSSVCPSGLFGLGGDGRNNLVCIDLASGHATPIGPLKNVKSNDGGLDFAPGGILYGLADAPDTPTKVIRVDPRTGEAAVVTTVTLNGKEIGGFEGLAIDQGVCAPAQVPGPTAIPALGAAGLLALAAALGAAAFAALRR